MKIAVLSGGVSTERDVSLSSGMAIMKALQTLGHEVLGIDTALGKDHLIALSETAINIQPPSLEQLNTLPASQQGYLLLETVQYLNRQNIDLVFNALHGGIGENGKIQSLLEIAQLRYTGSNALASALAMNKMLAKRQFESVGVRTPQHLFFNKHTAYPEFKKQVESKFRYPIVVKPNEEGSTVGLNIVHEGNDLESAWQAASALGDVLVETYIDGREITVSILGDVALPVIEIIPEGGFYDYYHKYKKGTTSYICPADLLKSMTEKVQKFAVLAYQVLGCSGYSRVDFRLGLDDKFYCLEVNTLPGMTETSLVPKAALAYGMDFNSLINRIIHLSL
jgi:D-alanine-D-alanine ligase